VKILFNVYPSAFQTPGGGEVQLMKTKEYLSRLGVDVGLFDQWKDSLEGCDIFHTFGSVKDSLSIQQAAKSSGAITALSTICWYDLRSAYYTYQDFRRRTLSLARHFAKLFVPLTPSMRKSLMHVSDILFPNSILEAQQLIRYFHIPKDRIFVVPNGVDERFLNADPTPFIKEYGLKDFILFVGRIEPRKNQLTFVRAMQDTKQTIVFLGGALPDYEAYYAQCKKEASPNMYFLDAVGHNDPLLASAYAACNTFVLPSWFETPGLSALEAAMAGAKVVITDGGCTSEYFGDRVHYVQPHDQRDIRRVTLEVFDQAKDNRLKEYVRREYSWTRVAEKTSEGYRVAMGRKSVSPLVTVP
jgi:glycosyltransferase involved in cell wall biosynthesis